MNPAESIPITPRTRAATSGGSCRLNSASASIHTDCIACHNSIEPSCEPQDAATRYGSGSSELEFSATLRTEKSFCTNDATRQAQANNTNRHWT